MTPEQLQSAREWAEHEHPMSYTLPADRFGGPDTFLRCPQCEQWSPCYVRMIFDELDAARAENVRLTVALNGFIWLGNNLHNIALAPATFRELYEAALVDANKALERSP